jgi:peptide/nickel transport system substrate-binding protein
MKHMLAALLSFTFLAAPLRAAEKPVKNSDTFTLAEVGEVTSLDPSYPYDASSQALLLNLYDTLIGFDGEALDRFVPLLASEVPSTANGGISPDGRTYRFHLRKDVKFHDGTPMTPEDVRYSLMRFMLMDRAGGPSSLLLEPVYGAGSTRDSSGTIKTDVYEKIDKALQVDGGDLVVKLPRPFAPFLAIMARWSYVVPKNWAKANGDWDGAKETWQKFNNPPAGKTWFHNHVNGTGPFKLERWDPIAKYVLITRNDGYWRDRAWLKRVLVKTVPEWATRRLMLQAGDADLIETLRPMVSQVEKLPGVRMADNLPRLVTDPVIFFTFKINGFANRDIGSGHLDGDGIPTDFFTDPDVRKGFSYAFDYDAFLKDTFKGAAQRAIGPVPPGMPGFDPKQPRYSFDLKKAEQHLKAAWGGKVWEKGFRFTLTYNVGSENRESACNILKKNIEKLNPRFKIDIRGVEWAAYLDKAQNRMMPMFSRGWYADYPDAHNFVYNFYDSQGRYPSAQGFQDVGLDNLIEKAAREVSPAERADLYKRILEAGYDAAPAIFTVHPRGVYAMRDWVDGFRDNPVYLGVYYYPIAKTYKR